MRLYWNGPLVNGITTLATLPEEFIPKRTVMGGIETGLTNNFPSLNVEIRGIGDGNINIKNSIGTFSDVIGVTGMWMTF